MTIAGSGSNAMLTDSDTVSTCGLVFAYNHSHLRVWAANQGIT